LHGLFHWESSGCMLLQPGNEFLKASLFCQKSTSKKNFRLYLSCLSRIYSMFDWSDKNPSRIPLNSTDGPSHRRTDPERIQVDVGDPLYPVGVFFRRPENRSRKQRPSIPTCYLFLSFRERTANARPLKE
jgi:hypothetical protein